TGLVAAGVIVAVLGSLARSPRRRDLTWLSLGLVAGVIGQIVLGGITVLVDLHPAAVQSHFLLSMVLVANAVWLVHRAGQPDRPLQPTVSPSVRRHVLGVAAATLVAIALGTVVTGAGPHAGDEKARRFGIEIGTAVRIHSVGVWLAVAAVVWLMWRLRTLHAERAVLDSSVVAWVCVAIAQGALGYLQYFTGVPAALVAIHVAGATLLWGITVWMVAVLRTADASTGETRHEFGTFVDDAREEPAHVADEVGEHLGAP
ncbi:MAG: COX15/CtaA family protein, partial [Ilumatobacteraceae bacterium]